MISIAFDKYTLPNGLQVILHEDHALPMAAVNIWYHVGSKDEDQGRTGFAHLFEHVMFEGSKNHNELFFNPLMKVGGAVNGSTSSDKTNYWENVPSDYLELALWLESDRMGFLLEALDQERLDLQRDVVKNERRQSYENRPYGMAYLLLQPALFPAPHPYSWPTIGSQEDLDAASLDDVKSFFRRFYSPSNATISIAGDIDPDETRALVERYFGEIPPTPAVNRIGRMASPLSSETRLDFHDKVQLPRLYLVWPSTPVFDVDEAPLDVLGTVLADGKSSRLYRTLVYEKQIARSVSVYNHAMEVAGEFNVQVTASPGHGLDEIQDVVEEELDRIRSEPLSERELERAKNRVESQHVRQLEQMGGFGGRADQLNYYNTFGGDPGMINTDLARFTGVQAVDVQRAAGRWLGAARVRMTVLPEQDKSATVSAVDRSVMPGGGEQKAFSPPRPERARLSNGTEVVFVERHGLPVVALGLMLRGGSASDPTAAPGLAHMTASMLTEGTASRTSSEIADEMEFLGSKLHAAAGREHVFVSAEALTQHWPQAFDIVADVLRNPTFPDDELERVRKERLADLKRISDEPVAISHRAIRSLVYGPESGYGHPSSGTTASVEAMSRADLLDYYSAHFGPQNATLLVVGDVDRDGLLARAEALLGDWGADAGEPKHASEAPRGAEPTTIYLVDRPGAPQSVIRAGHATVPRHDPDFFALNLVNYVFRAHPSARLFMNLRQDKGYSYGYYSEIDWLTGPSALLAGGSVQTAVTREALVETLKEFADIRGDRPVTPEEMAESKQGIFRSFPSQFESQGQVLQSLGRIVSFRLPEDYLETFIPSLDAVSLEAARNVAARRIRDRELVVLVVGDREAIQPGLEELGHPIVQVDMEGRPLVA